jgi:hypothetical protein
MSQPMGTFVPRPQQTGDRFQPSMGKGRPLIVQVLSVDGARAVAANGTQAATVKKAIFVHVWDLVGGPIAKDEHDNIVNGPPNTVYCDVQWMAGAVCDNLEPFVGAPAMPIKLVSLRNKNNTFNYITVQPVEGQELQYCNQVFASDPTRFDREYAQRQAQAAQQAAAPAYQAGGFQPMQVQPTQPQQPSAGPPWQQQAAPAAAQFQAPPGQPGPIAQIPAQVAQQMNQVERAMQLVQQGMTPDQAIAALSQQQAPAAVQQYAPYDAGIPGQLPVDPAAPDPATQTQQNIATANQALANGNGYAAPGAAQQLPAPQFQAPAGAPGQPTVHNSDVASIIARLTAQGMPG